MKNINYIIGNEKIKNLPLKTFDENVCEFLSEISSYLLKSSIIREYTDLTALAFWSRKANLQKIKQNFGLTDNRLGRGLCFHIAPSNVPINSIFSYFFGLLAGNSNIVRLSSKDFPQVDYICELISEKLNSFPEIKERTAFVKYEHSNDISEEFSRISDCRMIWGGNETINLFKSFKTKPRCIDITFPDRYSICILNAEKIKEADETEMKRLAENFYADTYLTDQNACSSPQLIYWLNYNSDSVEKFWQYIYEYTQSKYNLQDALCVDKYTKLCEDAIIYDNIGKTTFKTNLLYRSEILYLNNNMENIRAKGGYFYEYNLKDITELYSIITDTYQTITYFGIDAKSLQQDIINRNIRGTDRIVPVGKALDIGTIWDGHDLIRELSREILIQ